MGENRLSPRVKQVLKLASDFEIDINFGLAPKPFGFTFIRNNEEKFGIDRRLSKLLSEIELSSRETAQLKKALYD